MQTFNVYPKEGDPFSIEIQHFEITEKGDGFELYDDKHALSTEGLLSFDNVAAIIPDKQREKDMVCFLVHLKNRKPFPVYAEALEENESSITFKYQQKDMWGKVINETPVKGIYIALSEVVAIMPSDGLITRD